jgi:hypothetical protein
MIPEHFKEHLGEAIGRIGREPLGIGEMTDGVKSTVDIGGSID